MTHDERVRQIIEKAVGEIANISQPAPTTSDEGMPLQLDPKWKWTARDEDGRWHFYEKKPVLDDDERSIVGYKFTLVESVMLFPVVSNWRDSLHEIRNGRLIKHVDIPADGEPVMVRYGSDGEWMRRVSAGYLDNGELVCYAGGCNKWTAKSKGTSEWPNWRRPTQEELNQ